MASNNKLTEDDIRLFREAIGPVQPVVNTRVRTAARSKPPSPAPQEFRPTAPPYDITAIDNETSYLRAGHSPHLLKRLRRGQIKLDAEIDLHHMTRDEAYSVLQQFLDDCRTQHYTCVKIIHGKGLRSKTKIPVLKHATYQLLQQRIDVLAYVMAKPAQGGSGAVIVLLKKH